MAHVHPRVSIWETQIESLAPGFAGHLQSEKADGVSFSASQINTIFQIINCLLSKLSRCQMGSLPRQIKFIARHVKFVARHVGFVVLPCALPPPLPLFVADFGSFPVPQFHRL